MGCSGVLATFNPSAEMVASLQGSPVIGFQANELLCHVIEYSRMPLAKKDVLDADIPAFVFLFVPSMSNFWRLWEGIREHEIDIVAGKK